MHKCQQLSKKIKKTVHDRQSVILTQSHWCIIQSTWSSDRTVFIKYVILDSFCLCFKAI